MAVDGYAVRVDMSDFKALVSLLRICSNNLNQIAKRVNSTGNSTRKMWPTCRNGGMGNFGARSVPLLGKLDNL